MKNSLNKNTLKNQISDILLQKDEVEFAYLFGSTARNSNYKKSDVDIAVYLKIGVVEENKFYTEQLASEIEKNIKSPVDVRCLNKQGLIFLHQVLKYSELLVNKNNKKRISFETRVYDEYLDFKYYLDQYNTIRRKKLLS
jgi:uncharacterized protein